jgi:sterol desaturase/sphingolipid hydroxylase (fatty acid hydroxylase superfamily)
VKREGKVPPWLSALLAGGAYVTLLWWERRRPLRRQVEPKLRRNARNMTVAGLGAVVTQLAAAPILQPLASFVERRRWGLVPRLGLPRRLETVAALVLLDYTLYVWHVLAHKVPFLWRFHRVHHVDLDLDASTGIRFHFGELTMSVGWNALEVLLLGISPRVLSFRQTALVVSVLFHHSDVRLPLRVERWLSRLLVTPRMHGIHHSIVQEETDSNWSSGLTVWDRLHGTLRLDVPQEEITIGVPAFREPEQVTLPKLLALPFRDSGPDWVLPDGTRPERLPSLLRAWSETDRPASSLLDGRPDPRDDGG